MEEICKGCKRAAWEPVRARFQSVQVSCWAIHSKTFTIFGVTMGALTVGNTHISSSSQACLLMRWAPGETSGGALAQSGSQVRYGTLGAGDGNSSH